MAQETDCPAGFECLTPEPAVCLSRQALEQHEQDLVECRDRVEARLGRIEECRDAVEPLQVRVEKLSGQVGALQSERSMLERRRRLWRIVGLSAGGVAALSSLVVVGHVSGWWRLPAP